MVIKQNSGFVRIVIVKLHRESWFYSTKFSWPYKNAAVLFKCQDPSLFNLPCPLHPFISTQTSTNHYPLPFLQIFSLLLLIVVFILKSFLREKAFLYVLCGMWEVLIAILDFLPFLCHVCFFWVYVRGKKQWYFTK